MTNLETVKKTTYLAAVLLFMIAIQACKTHNFRSNYQDVNKLIHEADSLHTKPFLKAHLKNGDICILKDSWQIDSSQNIVSGVGSRYDFNRAKMHDGEISIVIDSVAIFETNVKLQDAENERIVALSILAGLDIELGIFCLLNPKACFGSCPTFYFNEHDNFHYADAEGFSNAIAPSLEYYDIDALDKRHIPGKTLDITMKNEALETHCIKNVKILAYPINADERVYQSPTNDFYLCKNNYALSLASANEGDITNSLQKNDRQERYSLSDANNLSSKEEIYLTYKDVYDTSNLGLIINFRQSLMTTYFIYSAMGYMGDEVSDIFAKLETNKDTKDKLKNGIQSELGGIEIYQWNDKNQEWEYQNTFYETGPIAINRQIIPLSGKLNGSDVKLKIIMNKGMWRLDYLALTNIKEIVTPLEYAPTVILNKGKQDSTSLDKINHADKYLISMPGSEYTFQFTFPETDKNYDFFLHTEGYYLEWMRKQWLKDKNLLKLHQMVYNPKKYLRKEAPTYKKYETSMEQQFWNSKIDTKTFSYDAQ